MNKSVLFENPISIAATSSVCGKKEGEGPLAAMFDETYLDDALGKSNWEAAETEMQLRAAEHLKRKSGLVPDILLGGDLQSQCTATSMTARRLGVPFMGLYGACSTMALSLLTASCLVSAGVSKAALCITSSHFCAAERQFRTPLNYGSKRAPTAQWTTTAAAAALLTQKKQPPYITGCKLGRVVDLAVKDPTNMGAAMAPAATDTLTRFFAETGKRADEYTDIYTGDLGAHGSELLLQLLEKEGIQLNNHSDCGCLLFDVEKQDVQSGGSGCGCSAAVLHAHVLPKLKKTGGKVLFMSTGALLSLTSVNQKNSIPGIAHLVEISAQ